MSAVLGYNDTEGGSAPGSQWGHSDRQVPLVLLDDALPVTHTTWAGRHALALPDAEIRRVAARLESQQIARQRAKQR